jgi:TolB-like protein/class 3 adenylate cyclase/Flp pilus assembly protein TadD
MNTSNEHRKLAAIMFTDMVGFSALSQRNEALALELLAENQRLLRAQFLLFNGHEVKSTGDGFLIEFPSALDATKCAVEIQRGVAARNSTQPAARQIQVRIGIHVGDVVHRDADVFGDGVNIAARIEPLAVGGGICLSETVQAQVRNKMEFELVKLDAPKLKHIEVPMDVYRVVLPWESGQRIIASHKSGQSAERSSNKSILRIVAIAGSLLLAGWACWLGVQSEKNQKPAVPSAAQNNSVAPTAPVVINEKSIAVLPFANMSLDKDNAFFADGMHEDILTSLGMVHDLRVVSRTSVEQYRNTTKPMRQIGQELGVAYVLEGSVQREGNEVRVTGQLIHAATDEHVWAKSYDRDLTNIFSIQSELATEIADSLSAVISPQEKSLIERKPTDNPAAYDLFLKARAILNSAAVLSRRDEAEQYLNEAVQLDPNFAVAWGYLALAHVRAVISDEDHSPERLAKAKAAIDTAVRLAPDDPEVIKMEGDYYYYGYRDYARAAEQFQKLLRLQPNSAEAYAQLGYILRRQSRWAEALANLRLAEQLDPRNPSVASTLTETFLGLDRYDEAFAESRHAAELDSGSLLMNDFSNMVVYTQTGSTRAAEEFLSKVQPTPAQMNEFLFLQRGMAVLKGDWAQALKIDRQDGYVDPLNGRWAQKANQVADLIGAKDLPAARTLAKKLIPEFKAALEQQPDNSTIWNQLSFIQAVLGENEQALASANKAVNLVPESVDAIMGTLNTYNRAQVLAWTGDKDGALAELARLLRTPYGANVYGARADPGWQPLQGDPRFDALLKNPTNNAPLLNDQTTAVLP